MQNKIIINNFLAVLTVLLTTAKAYGQSYPVFGNEIPVTINGLTLDAMEPFISPDGNAIIFNSLNDGINTSLYYAAKVNDSTFNFIGPVPLVNQLNPPHLDAVASQDSSLNFFWVSTRGYPGNYENLWHATTNSIGRVHGDFYYFSPGWIVMDAAINYDGNYLYYCNAWFGSCGNMPCYSQLGIAQKINDSTYNKLFNSNILLSNVNDTNYLIYAPQISSDGLELYFTRILKSNTSTEICVSVRANPSSIFSAPTVIYSNQPQFPEAPTITTNKNILYYHKKPGALYQIFMRYRTGTTGVEEAGLTDIGGFFPNPFTTQTTWWTTERLKNVTLTVSNSFGQPVGQIKNINGNSITLQRNNLPCGIYFARLQLDNKIIATKKIIITD